MANSSQARAGHSLGLKLIVIALLALLMAIPTLFVYVLVWDRSSRAEEVAGEVGWEAGGPQTLSGPILLVPVMEPNYRDVQPVQGQVEAVSPAQTRQIVGWARRTYVFLPDALTIDGDTFVELRKRSIFHVPVYSSLIKIDARFEGRSLPELDPSAQVLWGEARIALSVGDTRGFQQDLALTVEGHDASFGFEPGDGQEHGLSWQGAAVSAPVGSVLAQDKALAVHLDMRLSGASRLAFTPVGRQSDVTLRSDWPHPSFQGAFLAVDRTIDDTGFEARWSVPYLARSLPMAGWAETFPAHQLNATAFGVDFVLPGNPYQRVARALKYSVMFIGFVFLGYFLFEATSSRRVHAAQYILVGLAQVVFYLLLLSFAEQVGFEKAYGVAAGATVLLTALYGSFAFGIWRGLVGLLYFGGIYGLLYLLMSQEDLALLIGSVAAFIAIALTMLMTRNVDWYSEETGGDGR